MFVELSLDRETNVGISVYSIDGRIIATKRINSAGAGRHAISIGSNDAASGCRLMKITAGTTVTVVPLIR